jgi:hypothetical protein
MNTRDWTSKHPHILMFVVLTAVALIATAMFQIRDIIGEKHEALNLKLFCGLTVPQNAAEREAMRPQMVACVNSTTEELLHWEQVELDLLRNSNGGSVYGLENGSVIVANKWSETLRIVKRLQEKYFPPTTSTTTS